MNKNISELERHAAALGLTHEDPRPVQLDTAPVATSDRILLGVGCCLLAAGSALLSVWLIVPTLVVSGVAATLLLRHLNVATSLPAHRWTGPEAESSGDWLLRKLRDDARDREEEWNRDIVSNPVFREMPCNLYYDRHRQE